MCVNAPTCPTFDSVTTQHKKTFAHELKRHTTGYRTSLKIQRPSILSELLNKLSNFPRQNF